VPRHKQQQVGTPLKVAREPADPTRLQAAVYWAKLQANRARRAAKNWRGPVPHLHPGNPADFPVLLAESRTPLWGETDPREKRLQLGKVQNLRMAVRQIDCRVVPEGGEFSFWAQVGMPSTGKGYVPGRQIQEGCVVPAVAGGICQLSNALYDVVLRAGFEVTERHAHTRALPSATWSAGRDATVAWNHIDLRFRAPVEAMVRARMTADELVVQVLAHREFTRAPSSGTEAAQEACESCETCGMSQCWRHKTFNNAQVGTTNAWLVDQVWPEYAALLRSQGTDALFVPIKGKDRYAWPMEAARRVEDARLLALKRAWSSRRLSEQGAERQQAMLLYDFLLAQEYEKKLRFDATHLVVAQTLLPYLWGCSALGGRTFDVLMVRRPMRSIHAVLDAEQVRHPERRLLGDFRAHDMLVEAEEEALAAASRVYTPHPEIAAMFGDRAVLLDWSLPAAKGIARGDRIAFPGPTVSRKGAYELREAARTLGLKVRLCGSELEGPGFWDGIDVDRPSGDWLAGCCAVVQPAVLEDQPRKLLRAIAEGVPVIAAPACGVSHLPGVTTVSVGDADALAGAIQPFAR
jgi:hypothetical protein